MFNFLKRNAKSAPKEATLRGCLPTYVTDQAVILSKIAPSIRNTYEIRLALFMAKSKGLRFILAVPKESSVAADVRQLLHEHGGTLEIAKLDDFSVYCGRATGMGDEDGWVLGNSETLQRLRESIRDPLLRDRLRIGASIEFDELAAVEDQLSNETFRINNIDGEDVNSVLLTLIAAARAERSTVFIQ